MNETICGKSFGNKEDLKDHIRNEHKNVEPEILQDMQKKFKYKTTMEYPIEHTHGGNNKHNQ